MTATIDQDAPIRGRCACGGVRLVLTPPTVFASHCHCESCRRSHAAPLVTWTAVAEAAFTVASGAELLVAYASSPGVTRSFCGRCGTQLVYRMAGLDRVYVPVAVLDRTDRPIEGHVSYEERVSWLAGLESLPCFHAKGDQALPWDAGRGDLA